MADSDNVIIFGAGASFDAGIPLLSNFVETMWNFHFRQQANGSQLSGEDQKIFHEAMEIKNGLDSYHGRALFDDRNLEDILSLLSFEDMRNVKTKKKLLPLFVKAISRTIELTCKVKFEDSRAMPGNGYDDVYRMFWRSLFRWFKKSDKFPSVLTFNYDLVLERALFQVLNHYEYNIPQYGFDSVGIDYHFNNYSKQTYSIRPIDYCVSNNLDMRSGTQAQLGTGKRELPIDILKLHGSLNFPASAIKDASKLSLTAPCDNPLILPPIINKMSAGHDINNVWVTAMDRLRNAKNVIIVGYSLPQTDIYMQFFFKTALGPNVNLSRIYVFDPVLFGGGQTAEDMIARYKNCFAPQLQNRIVFKPESYSRSGNQGTFQHFVGTLQQAASSILF